MVRVWALIALCCIPVSSGTDNNFAAAIKRSLAKAQQIITDFKTDRIHHACETEDGSAGHGAGTEVCNKLHARRLGAELMTKAEDTVIESEAERCQVAEFMQTEHLDEQESWRSEKMNMDTVRKLACYCKGKCLDDGYFYQDEKPEPAERRLWKGRVSAAALPWKNRLVKYTFHPELAAAAKKVFLSAKTELEERTCIRFEEVAESENTPEPKVYVRSDKDGCYSQLGTNPNSQRHQLRELNLAWGCQYHGIALHEIIHALGATHEQCRLDRDTFVEIKSENIKDWESKKHNFAARENTYTSMGYDYQSLMHYDRYAFSSNYLAADIAVGWVLGKFAEYGWDTGKPTIITKNRDYAAVIGQRSKLSEGDLEQLIHMYECPKLVLESDEHSGAGLKPTTSNGYLAWTKTGYEAVEAVCAPGFAATGCSCFHDSADACRGAMFTSLTGSVCAAAGIAGAASGLKAHVVCHKLSSPHYTLNRMSAQAKSVAWSSCPDGAGYKLLGCNCLTQEGGNCDAVPSAGNCTAYDANGQVSAQAVCIKAPAATKIEIVKGALGSNSTAVCPTGTELTGCSCAGKSGEEGKEQCNGARPNGPNSNQCFARAKSGQSVHAYAVCATLADSTAVVLPAASTFESDKGTDIGPNQPLQSLYCEDTDRRCFAQARNLGIYDCKDNCKSFKLDVDPSNPVTVTTEMSSSQAKCPPSYVATEITCNKFCQVKCHAPPSDAPWFLSGGTSVSRWFAGKTGLGMATCGDGLIVGIQCGSESLDVGSTCESKQLLCRRAAVVAGDDTERRGAFDVRLIYAKWSDWISSTGFSEMVTRFDFADDINELVNTDMHPVQTMQCAGKACDDMRFYMPKNFGTFSDSADLKGTQSIWTQEFEGTEMKCPPGHYVASMKCTGSYCYKKQLLCATPNSKWMVTGHPYYTNCMTNEMSTSWEKWWSAMGEWVRGRARTCAGASKDNMPDKQSCGEDGVMVGLKCFGDSCDRIQMICSTVGLNEELETGKIRDVIDVVSVLESQGLYVDPGKFNSPPTSDAPSTSYWDGTSETPGKGGAAAKAIASAAGVVHPSSVMLASSCVLALAICRIF